MEVVVSVRNGVEVPRLGRRAHLKHLVLVVVPPPGAEAMGPPEHVVVRGQLAPLAASHHLVYSQRAALRVSSAVRRAEQVLQNATRERAVGREHHHARVVRERIQRREEAELQRPSAETLGGRLVARCARERPDGALDENVLHAQAFAQLAKRRTLRRVLEQRVQRVGTTQAALQLILQHSSGVDAHGVVRGCEVRPPASQRTASSGHDQMQQTECAQAGGDVRARARHGHALSPH
eukprot:4951915-Pyramimonas_sp.AAC.1